MLAALNCQPVDYPPCCFMQFTTLWARCKDQFEMIAKQLGWGLDATIQIPPWLLPVPPYAYTHTDDDNPVSVQPARVLR